MSESAAYIEAMQITDLKPDFIAHFGDFSTCWTITAETEAAKEFARDNFSVECWMGEPEHFTTDWRPARDIVRRLAEEEGFTVCHKRPDGVLGVWAGRR